MKKFIFKLLIYCIVFTLIPSTFCAVMDPYNVMHPLSLRDNGVEPNKNFIKMTYILNNKQKFDSFLFGSSRVGNFHVENIPDEHCYNMTYSYGIPDDHLANIKTFIKNGVIPEKIYMGVDSLSYTADPAESMVGYRMSYEYLTENKTVFLKTYLDPSVVGKAALEIMKGHKKTKNYAERFYEYGWNSDYKHRTSYDFDTAEADIGRAMRMDETLASISEIKNICTENGIELVVFTNPMYSVTHRASLEKDYLVFLERLAEITPYYNFSGYNGITLSDKNYIDSSHYTAEVSDILIDCMCKGETDKDLYKEGFGWYVTEENINSLISLLEAQSE